MGFKPSAEKGIHAIMRLLGVLKIKSNKFYNSQEIYIEINLQRCQLGTQKRRFKILFIR